MKHLLLTTALVAATATGAFAQDTKANTDTNAQANAQAQAGGNTPFFTESSAQDFRASDFIGMRVYASKAGYKQDSVEAAAKDWDDIGEVNDVILNHDGQVEAVLVDIGGFLGIGEHQVAVNMDSIKFVSDSSTGDNEGDFFLVLNADKQTLENAPTWGEQAKESMDSAANDVKSGAQAAGDKVEQTAEAAGDKADQAMDKTAQATDNAMDKAGQKTEQAADAAGNAADEAGQEMKQAANDAGQAVENAGDKVQEETAEATGAKPETDADANATASADASASGNNDKSMQSADASDSNSNAAQNDQTMKSADASNGNAAQNDQTMKSADASDNSAAQNDQPMTADNGMTREGYANAGADYLTTENLTGARVYDKNDKWIGEISELLVDEQGKITDAIVDVGGFLGIGEKPVALQLSDLQILREDNGDDVRVYTAMAEDQLESMPEFEK